MLNFNLKKQGILGMNARNVHYIGEYNERRYYPLVDDKLATKKLATDAGIPCPELYAVIEHQEQIRRFHTIMEGHKDFVVKPAKGSGGGGITVITDTTAYGCYVKGSGAIMTPSLMQYNISNVLSGLHSLGGSTDKAVVEYRIRNIPMFAEVAFQGVPDIRVLVYKGVPAMAMLRLPTRESDGKANLHSGGIGVGISMETGITCFGVQFNRYIDRHPDTGLDIQKLQIPEWINILTMAARFEAIIGLGYIGVDIVLDRERGPMLLEVNARPGLAIQIANREGLRHRLNRIDAHISELDSIYEKVQFSQQQFG